MCDFLFQANEKELRKIYYDLEDCEYAILDKSFSIMSSLPKFVLELIPSLKGDSSLVRKLQVFRQMMKAKMRRTKMLIKKNHRSPNKHSVTPEKRIQSGVENSEGLNCTSLNKSLDEISSKTLNDSVRLNDSFVCDQSGNYFNDSNPKSSLVSHDSRISPHPVSPKPGHLAFSKSSMSNGILEHMNVDEAGDSPSNSCGLNGDLGVPKSRQSKSPGSFKLKQPSKLLLTITPNVSKDSSSGTGETMEQTKRSLHGSGNVYSAPSSSTPLSSGRSMPNSSSSGSFPSVPMNASSSKYNSNSAFIPTENITQSSLDCRFSGNKFIPLRSSSLDSSSSKYESATSHTPMSSQSSFGSPLPTSEHEKPPVYTPVFSKQPAQPRSSHDIARKYSFQNRLLSCFFSI